MPLGGRDDHVTAHRQPLEGEIAMTQRFARSVHQSDAALDERVQRELRVGR